MVLNIEVGMGKPASLGGKKSVWKVLILLHEQTKRRFHLTEFVNFAEYDVQTLFFEAKGFICEICNNDYQILFPFEKDAAVCPQCEAAFHKRCYAKRINEDGQECVRCVRIQAKKSVKSKPVRQESNQDEESDSSLNY